MTVYGIGRLNKEACLKTRNNFTIYEIVHAAQ